MIKYEELRPVYQEYVLGQMDVEDRTDAEITLHVYADNSAAIFAGYDTMNIHGLQYKDVHGDGRNSPNFAYKRYFSFENVLEAIDAYNVWLSHREENIRISKEWISTKCRTK